MNRPWFTEPRWHLAGFLGFAAALNYADRAALSSVLPALRTSFVLSDGELGLLGSMFLWSYALASPLAGILADRWSRARLVVLSLVLWSVVTGLMGTASGFVALLVLRAALGLVESLYLPAAMALIADHHGPATRGRAMSIHTIGLNFGIVLGGAFAGYLADAWGWRSGFWILGGAGLLLAAGSGPFLGITPPGRATTQASSPPAKSPALRPTLLETLTYLAGVPSFLVLLAKAVLAGVGIWVFLNWLPLYFREAFDLTLGAAGFAGTFMLQISTVLGMALGGWVSDRVAAKGGKNRMLVQSLSYFAAAPFLLLFLTHPGIGVVTVAVSAFSLFRGFGGANENPTLCEIVPVQYRSTAIGIMNTCATAAGGVGVLLAGLLKRALGLNAIFAGISLLFVLAGLGLFAAYRWSMARDLERARTHSL